MDQTFQLLETGELEQEFGQWTQESALTAKSVVFIVITAVGELRPAEQDINKLPVTPCSYTMLSTHRFQRNLLSKEAWNYYS